MLCEKCNANHATVHIKQVFGANSKTVNLCESCAGQNGQSIFFGDLFQNLMDAFFEQSPTAKQTAPVMKIKCAECGMTFETLKNTSKFGCAECYNAFRDKLEHILKNIHGSNTHEGKMPARAGRHIKKHSIARLRDALKKAVDAEQYEEAAKLRDEIKRITEETGDINA